MQGHIVIRHALRGSVCSHRAISFRVSSDDSSFPDYSVTCWTFCSRRVKAIGTNDRVLDIPAIDASSWRRQAVCFHAQVTKGFMDEQSLTALTEHRSSFFHRRPYGFPRAGQRMYVAVCRGDRSQSGHNCSGWKIDVEGLLTAGRRGSREGERFVQINRSESSEMPDGAFHVAHLVRTTSDEDRCRSVSTVVGEWLMNNAGRGC